MIQRVSYCPVAPGHCLQCQQKWNVANRTLLLKIYYADTEIMRHLCLRPSWFKFLNGIPRSSRSDTKRCCFFTIKYDCHVFKINDSSINSSFHSTQPMTMKKEEKRTKTRQTSENNFHSHIFSIKYVSPSHFREFQTINKWLDNSYSKSFIPFCDVIT